MQPFLLQDLFKMPQCRKEVLCENPITVFNEGHESLKFAAQIAALKTIQNNNEPFYVANLGRVNELLDEWQLLLPRIQPFYSVNCNSDTVLLRLMANNPSVGFHCTTPNNMRNVLDYAAPDRIIYANPCWTRSALKQAASQDVGLIGFESERDLDRISRCHPNAKLILNVCVNPDSVDPNAQFGCPLEKAPEVLQMAMDLDLNCVGLAFNMGADSICPEIYTRSIDCMAQLFDLAYSMGLKLNVLNIGGGFSAFQQDSNHGDRFAEICDQINKSLDFYLPTHRFPELRVIATPGRFFAGSVFSLITNIVERRAVDASFITNDDFDSGKVAFLYKINEGYYGSFGCRMMPNCEPVCTPLFTRDLDEDHSLEHHVYGSILGPDGFEPADFDVVRPRVHLRPLHVGEWLIWPDMGAYTLNNRGTLEDEEEDGGKDGLSPAIFYFATQKDWVRLAERPMADSLDETESLGSEGQAAEQDELQMSECSSTAGDREYDDDNDEKLWMMFDWCLTTN